MFGQIDSFGVQVLIELVLGLSWTCALFSRLKSKVANHDILFVACSNVTFDVEARSMISRDCVNGTWFPNDFNGGWTNYSHLLAELGKRREIEKYREETIHYEQDITIFNRTK